MNPSQQDSTIRDILSIEEFKLPAQDVKEVYPRCYALPQFFIDNLMSKNRIVKYFTGRNALIEAFYFQLFRLALDLEGGEINYGEILMKKLVFYEMFEEGELGDEIFTDFQYRKFLKDFFEVVEKDTHHKFQQKVQEYPIIDQVFKKMFKALVPIPLLASLEDPEITMKYSVQEVLELLCRIFSITLTQVGPCFKLEESDSFIYFQHPNEVYLAYNDQYQEEESEENSQLKSSFKCGEGNSFVTKYQSQTLSGESKTKTFEKSKFYRTEHSEDAAESVQEVKYPTVSPLLNLKHMSCLSKQDPKRIMQDQLSSPVLLRGPALVSAFKGVEVGQKENKDLYSEFTNTFILKQVSPNLRKNVEEIKIKYRERSSIRPVF